MSPFVPLLLWVGGAIALHAALAWALGQADPLAVSGVGRLLVGAGIGGLVSLRLALVLGAVPVAAAVLSERAGRDPEPPSPPDRRSRGG